MSHFAVAVFTDGTKTVEELLAPFDENIKVAPYVTRTKAQIIEEAKKRKAKYEEKIKDTPKLRDEQFVKKYLDATTDEELYQAEYDEYSTYDEDGNELSTYNPNSQWDWYSIGGRWRGCLKATEGEAGEASFFDLSPDKPGRFSAAKIKNIDFTPDKDKYEKCLRYWEVVVEGSPLKPEEKKEDFFNFYKKEWYLEHYKTKEEYAERQTAFITYAVVMPDGRWYEKGKMGWWGISSETHEEAYDWDKNYKQNFIDKADPEWTLTIVDCHI